MDISHGFGTIKKEGETVWY